MSTDTLSSDNSGGAAAPHPVTPARFLSPVSFYAIALSVVVLDQAVKAWVRQALPVHETIPLWAGVFQLTHAQNKGMAFSLLEGRTSVLIIAAVLVSLGIVWVQVKAGRTLGRLAGVALALPLGGATGNLIDRVWQGYVTDLFDFKLINFPIFNVADSAICIGIGLLIFRTLTTPEPPRPQSGGAARDKAPIARPEES